MWEIEGLESVISSLTLAKELYDNDRIDVIKRFYDVLDWDSYYGNMLEVISSVFSVYECYFDENNETELMTFADGVISGYFSYAWEYGEQRKIHYSQNPYITQANDEIQRWFGGSCCIEWKLLAYIRTQKSAWKSKLHILMHNSCGGCYAHEGLAYGLIQLYTWFKDKCAEFEALKIHPVKPTEDVLKEAIAA